VLTAGDAAQGGSAITHPTARSANPARRPEPRALHQSPDVRLQSVPPPLRLRLL